MTISTTNITKSYNGNGSTHSFAYDFPIFADADLTVIVRSSTGAETTKTLNTHYVVTGAGAPSGGNVLFKFNTGTSSDAHYSLTDQRPANGETVVIRSELSNTQTLDLVANDPFPASSFETALDRLVRMVQQHDEELDRSIKLSRTNTMTSTEFTNSATDRASKILAFDSAGELSVTSELGTFRGNWAASTTYALRDIVKDTSTNNIFIATTAHTSSGAQPLTTNTDSANWSLLVDAASATTAQNAAATSATAAATSETASATSATASATSATASATSETNANDWAVKVDGIVDSTDYSSKAWSIGGVGVTDTAGAGPAKDWATETTGQVDGTEYSAKEYAIGAQVSNTSGSAKQWSLGGGTGFDRDTAVTGSGITAEYSARYWANQAANSAQDFVDVYYGSFTSDTAAEDYQINDNQGSVNVGDLYFNSSDNVMRVRSFAGWNDVAADTTNFATNGFSIAMSIAL